MKIEGKITFKSEKAGELINIIADSLAPDNVPGIITIVRDDSATVIFKGEKVGTILSSVDDYLMNAAIVEKLSFNTINDHSGSYVWLDGKNGHHRLNGK